METTRSDIQPSPVPRVGVGAVVFRGEAVLLVKRANPPLAGEWSLPGGKLHWGERLTDGVAREVREETGIEIEVLGLVDVIDAILSNATGDVQYHYTLVDYAALWRSGNPVAASDAAEAAFFEPAALAALPLWPQTRAMIEKAKPYVRHLHGPDPT
ncbi:MAG: NUDIX hydrolase [Pseudomonadota bacterium]